jgi:hypothetical protein
MYMIIIIHNIMHHIVGDVCLNLSKKAESLPDLKQPSVIPLSLFLTLRSFFFLSAHVFCAILRIFISAHPTDPRPSANGWSLPGPGEASPRGRAQRRQPP